MLLVRRVAATNLGKFAATVESSVVRSDIMSMFEDLTQDDQDSIRLLAVEGCAALGKLLDPQDCVGHIIHVIVNFSQDKSWRVRYMVANQLYELCGAVGPKPTRTDLIPAHVQLIRDNEAEVRIAAVREVTKLCRIVNLELAIQHILSCVKELSSDSSQHVRFYLASVMMGMTSVLGEDATIEQLLPMYMKICQSSLKIEVVELDPVVLEVAREYFGFKEDARLKVYIGGGIEFVKEMADSEAGSTRSVVKYPSLGDKTP